MSLSTLSDEQIGRLAYLVILGLVLLLYALVSARGRVLPLVRQLLLWALLFVGTASAYGLWQSLDFSGAVVQTPNGDGLVLRRGLDGQFHLPLSVTGPAGVPVTINFIVDTGASDLVLRRQDAAKLGFSVRGLRFTGIAHTANGITRTASVRLARVDLDNHVATNVRALVNEGDLHASLLGMGYLERFSRIEISRDRLTIRF